MYLPGQLIGRGVGGQLGEDCDWWQMSLVPGPATGHGLFHMNCNEVTCIQGLEIRLVPMLYSMWKSENL